MKTTGLPASIQQLSVDLNSFQTPWPSTVSSSSEYNKLLSLWASSDERAATRSFSNLDSTVLVHVASSRDRQILTGRSRIPVRAWEMWIASVLRDASEKCGAQCL